MNDPQPARSGLIYRVGPPGPTVIFAWPIEKCTLRIRVPDEGEPTLKIDGDDVVSMSPAHAYGERGFD